MVQDFYKNVRGESFYIYKIIEDKKESELFEEANIDGIPPLKCIQMQNTEDIDSLYCVYQKIWDYKNERYKYEKIGKIAPFFDSISFDVSDKKGYELTKYQDTEGYKYNLLVHLNEIGEIIRKLKDLMYGANKDSGDIKTPTIPNANYDLESTVGAINTIYSFLGNLIIIKDKASNILAEKDVNKIYYAEDTRSYYFILEPKAGESSYSLVKIDSAENIPPTLEGVLLQTYKILYGTGKMSLVEAAQKVWQAIESMNNLLISYQVGIKAEGDRWIKTNYSGGEEKTLLFQDTLKQTDIYPKLSLTTKYDENNNTLSFTYKKVYNSDTITVRGYWDLIGDWEKVVDGSNGGATSEIPIIELSGLSNKEKITSIKINIPKLEESESMSAFDIYLVSDISGFYQDLDKRSGNEIKNTKDGLDAELNNIRNSIENLGGIKPDKGSQISLRQGGQIVFNNENGFNQKQYFLIFLNTSLFSEFSEALPYSFMTNPYDYEIGYKGFTAVTLSIEHQKQNYLASDVYGPKLINNYLYFPSFTVDKAGHITNVNYISGFQVI